MSIKTKDGRYMCSYCKIKHSDPIKASVCLDSHDLVYLRISRDDLNRLHNYLYSGDRRLITETLVDSVKGLLRRALVGEKEEE